MGKYTAPDSLATLFLPITASIPGIKRETRSTFSNMRAHVENLGKGSREVQWVLDDTGQNIGGDDTAHIYYKMTV
jgi:hypothetical protein